MWMREQQRHENLTYLVLWGMLFAAPVLSLYVRTVNDSSFDFNWNEVLMVWKLFAIYLVIFLFHNFFLAHLLVYKQKRVIYFSAIAIIIAAFIAYQCTNRPMRKAHGPHDKPRHERMEDRHRPPIDDMSFGFDHEPPRPDRFHHQDKKPPVMVGEHDIIALVVLILMLGMNLGIKLYFKSRRDSKVMAALEKENLEQQLEYLRYQINPHFFMNTLNNIHALVDINPEKAKDTILELSKMMRFILYEGDKKGVPLSREFEFIRNYVTLMRLRYTDKVKLQVNLPTEVPDYEIPPLILITFIENAFKHGISYQHDSFIHVTVEVKDNQLCFECRNSKADKPNEEKGGVGLANVKQRLNLIYGENYTLNIQDDPDCYDVKLEIPLS